MFWAVAVSPWRPLPVVEGLGRRGGKRDLGDLASARSRLGDAQRAGDVDPHAARLPDIGVRRQPRCGDLQKLAAALGEQRPGTGHLNSEGEAGEGTLGAGDLPAGAGLAHQRAIDLGLDAVARGDPQRRPAGRGQRQQQENGGRKLETAGGRHRQSRGAGLGRAGRLICAFLSANPCPTFTENALVENHGERTGLRRRCQRTRSGPQQCRAGARRSTSRAIGCSAMAR